MKVKEYQEIYSMYMLNQACIDNVIRNLANNDKLAANQKLRELSKNKDRILSLFENKLKEDFEHGKN